MRRVIETAHARVTELLTVERRRLDRLAQALLVEETLDEDAAYAAAGMSHVRPIEATPAAGGYG